MGLHLLFGLETKSVHHSFIASNVPERMNESPMESAEQVIAALGSNSTGVNFSVSTNIIRAVRLNNRNP